MGQKFGPIKHNYYSASYINPMGAPGHSIWELVSSLEIRLNIFLSPRTFYTSVSWGTSVSTHFEGRSLLTPYTLLFWEEKESCFVISWKNLHLTGYFWSLYLNMCRYAILILSNWICKIYCEIVKCFVQFLLIYYFSTQS